MAQFLPIYPLETIVFPGEKLNLNVSDSVYIALIKDCLEQKKEFGIPYLKNGEIQELGTSIEIHEIVKTHDNGSIDVCTLGKNVFKILDIIHEVPDKAYKGAIVHFPENELDRHDTQISDLIMNEVKHLYKLFNLEEKLPKFDNDSKSYSIAHVVGFSKEQEFEFLSLFQETQRLEYIRRHLKNISDVISNFEEFKLNASRNGQFRKLS